MQGRPLPQIVCTPALLQCGLVAPSSPSIYTPRKGQAAPWGGPAQTLGALCPRSGSAWGSLALGRVQFRGDREDGEPKTGGLGGVADVRVSGPRRAGVAPGPQPVDPARTCWTCPDGQRRERQECQVSQAGRARWGWAAAVWRSPASPPHLWMRLVLDQALDTSVPLCPTWDPGSWPSG